MQAVNDSDEEGQTMRESVGVIKGAKQVDKFLKDLPPWLLLEDNDLATSW